MDKKSIEEPWRITILSSLYSLLYSKTDRPFENKEQKNMSLRPSTKINPSSIKDVIKYTERNPYTSIRKQREMFMTLAYGRPY